MRVVAMPGVFRPDGDSWLLAQALSREPRTRGGHVLDLCTGSGVLAIAAARSGAARVDAVDVSRRAVASARLNAALNGVSVNARRGDLLAPFAARRFDVIVSNPPYLPGDHELPGRGPERAWEGGRDGRVLIDRILREAPCHLNPGGRLLLVHSTVSGVDATLAGLRAAGLEPTVLVRQTCSFGKLLKVRAAEFRSRGLLRPDQQTDEVVVLEGRANGVPRRDVSEPARNGTALSRSLA
jgi:release factor glutamine methyltransferase